MEQVQAVLEKKQGEILEMSLSPKIWRIYRMYLGKRILNPEGV